MKRKWLAKAGFWQPPWIVSIIFQLFSRREGADIFLDYLSDQSKSMSVLYRTQIS